MEDRLGALRRRANRVRAAEIAVNELDLGSVREIVERSVRQVVEGPDVVTVGHEPGAEAGADEPGSAGHEGTHGEMLAESPPAR